MLLATPPLTTTCFTGTFFSTPVCTKSFASRPEDTLVSWRIASRFPAHHRKASSTFSSSCVIAASWKARASARRCASVSTLTRVRRAISSVFEESVRVGGAGIPCSAMYLSTALCNPEKENFSSFLNGTFIFSTLGNSSSPSPPIPSLQKASSAAPGARPLHSTRNSLATLSIVRPTASSDVVARILNLLREEESSRSVWPPEIRSVRKGNVGLWEGGEVRRGVSAWACFYLRQRAVLRKAGWPRRGRVCSPCDVHQRGASPALQQASSQRLRTRSGSPAYQVLSCTRYRQFVTCRGGHRRALVGLL